LHIEISLHAVIMSIANRQTVRIEINIGSGKTVGIIAPIAEPTTPIG